MLSPKPFRTEAAFVALALAAWCGTVSCSSSPASPLPPGSDPNSSCFEIDDVQTGIPIECGCGTIPNTVKGPAMDHCSTKDVAPGGICCGQPSSCICFKVGCRSYESGGYRGCMCGPASYDGTTSCTAKRCCTDTHECNCDDVSDICGPGTTQVPSCSPQQVTAPQCYTGVPMVDSCG